MACVPVPNVAATVAIPVASRASVPIGVVPSKIVTPPVGTFPIPPTAAVMLTAWPKAADVGTEHVVELVACAKTGCTHTARISPKQRKRKHLIATPAASV